MARLLFLGDVYLPHPVEVRADLSGHLVYNLEAPITPATRGWPGTVNLKCERDDGPTTFGRPALAVCLANNHIMDFGEQGLADTLDALERAGVAHFGAGTRTDNCNNPLVLEVEGHRVGFVGYVCRSAHPVFATAAHAGVAPIEMDRIARDVAEARADGAERVIVSLHWGIEEAELPRPDDVRLARSVVELGADLVIGHHAHCIQPYEVHRGTHVFYGLGNAIFPDVDVPSGFDDAGVPRERFRKLQNYWNRDSLAVSYDVASGDVSIDRITCDGRSLRRRRRGVAGPRLPSESEAAYADRFRRHLFRATWRKKLVNLARRPKLPRARHLRSLVGILREARGAD